MHYPLNVFVIFVSIFIFIFGTIHAFPIYFFFFLFRVLNMYGQSVYCVVVICRIFSIVLSNDLFCVADDGDDPKDSLFSTLQMIANWKLKMASLNRFIQIHYQNRSIRCRYPSSVDQRWTSEGIAFMHLLNMYFYAYARNVLTDGSCLHFKCGIR